MTESKSMNGLAVVNGDAVHKPSDLKTSVQHPNEDKDTLFILEDDCSPRTASTKPSVLHNAIVRIALRNGFFIGSWYVLSMLLSVYNKKLMGKEHGIFGQGGFPAPLLFACVQFGVQFCFARLLLHFRVVERSSSEPVSSEEYYRSVIPNGIATGLDIGLSIFSLRFISLSFYTMCKSTTPLFLMVFAISMGLERASMQMALVGLTITPGLVLLVMGEKQFHLVGFILVMLASALSGLRWAITQIQLQGKGCAGGHGAAGGSTPIEVLEQLTPIASVTVGSLSLIVEQLWVTLPASTYFDTPHHTLLSVALMLFGGLLAFWMVWAEFKVIAFTSALTLIVAGVFKEILTVVAGVQFFGDHFTTVNAVGLIIVISGVVMYNYHKYKKMKAGELVASQKPGRKPITGEGDDEELLPLREDLESNGLHPVAATTEFMATKKRGHESNPDQ